MLYSNKIRTKVSIKSQLIKNEVKNIILNIYLNKKAFFGIKQKMNNRVLKL